MRKKYKGLNIYAKHCTSWTYISFVYPLPRFAITMLAFHSDHFAYKVLSQPPSLFWQPIYSMCPFKLIGSVFAHKWCMKDKEPVMSDRCFYSYLSTDGNFIDIYTEMSCRISTVCLQHWPWRCCNKYGILCVLTSTSMKHNMKEKLFMRIFTLGNRSLLFKQ